ncbi:MAG TPA: hypothetical protein VNJ08_02950 [Bacteriovoracaceae bacterium]|nr:hypothetical protein [Bacteriovoracaceae bacterium]
MKNTQRLTFSSWVMSRDISPIWYFLVTIIVILGSVRGILVVGLDFPPGLVYSITAASLIGLAAWGFLKKRLFSTSEFVLLKNLVNFNLFLGIFYTAIELYVGAGLDYSLFYVYLAPYIIFLLFRIPDHYLKFIVIIVTLLISYSVYDNFSESLKGTAGFDYVFAYNSKLRPGLIAMSHTGNIFRAGGYTGSYHDSAHILGMSICFFYIRFLLQKKAMDLAIFLIALKCITLTQSAANIVFVIFTLMAFTFYILLRNQKVSTFLYFIVGGIAIAGLVFRYGDVMSIFLQRIGPEGDWKGMLNKLGLGAFIIASPFLISGHAQIFSSEIIMSEIALVKIMFQFGLINGLALCAILLFPLYYFYKSRLRVEVLPALGPIVFGFLSLIHYGSLFRVTSIFLFFVFYTMCLISLSKINQTAIS